MPAKKERVVAYGCVKILNKVIKRGSGAAIGEPCTMSKPCSVTPGVANPPPQTTLQYTRMSRKFGFDTPHTAPVRIHCNLGTGGTTMCTERYRDMCDLAAFCYTREILLTTRFYQT